LLQDGSHELETWIGFSDLNQENRRKSLQALHIASYFGLTAYAEHLVKNGVDLNCRDEAERTPVMFASGQGHSETLSALLQRKADPQACDCLGMTPLHIAAVKNQGRIVDILIRSGANPMAPKANGETGKLLGGGWYSSIPRTRERLGYGDPTPGTESLIGLTPMQFACEQGSTEAAASLMRHLDPTIRMTIPLHWAAAEGHSEVLSLLLQFPEVVQNIDRRDASGNTALFLASQVWKPEAVRVLLEFGANVHLVSDDVRRSNKPLQKRRQIDQAFGKTALHAWAGMGCYSRKYLEDCTLEDMETIATLLIESGCDVDARDLDGRTALFGWIYQTCVGNGPGRCERFVSVLLRHGANPMATDRRGNTPLHMWTGAKCEDRAIQLLLNAGANINAARTLDGWTPLHSAISRCRDLDFDRFIGYGADFNRQDHDGNTPLHLMLKDSLSNKDHLENLLAFCDPTIKNRLGETCLFNISLQFVGFHKEDIISLLLRNGVQLEQKNIFGRTALLEACRNGGG
jgi:ankyrin repeat protein